MKTLKKLFITVFILALAFNTKANKIEKHTSFQVKISGKGSPIFLIPGIVCSGDVWDETIKHYEKNYTCYAFTLAGFAGAKELNSDVIMPTIQKDLIQYIKSHSNNDAILIGHSMGGFYGLLIASAEPNLLKKLIVVDALPFLMAAQDSNQTEEKIKVMLKGSERMYVGLNDSIVRIQQMMILRGMITDEKKIEKACEWSMNSDRATMGITFCEMMSKDLRKEISKIKTPTMVMVAWDKPIPQYPTFTKESSYQVYANQYKNLKPLTLKQTENSKHFIMYDQPQWFLKNLDEFIR